MVGAPTSVLERKVGVLSSVLERKEELSDIILERKVEVSNSTWRGRRECLPQPREEKGSIYLNYNKEGVSAYLNPREEEASTSTP